MLEGFDNEEEMQKMLDLADHVAKKYLMEYGPDKSKVMAIGKPKHKPDFKLGDLELEYTEEYKYLGVVINEKWNLGDQIKNVKGKAEAAYQTILSIGQDRNFKNIEMEAIWKLYDTCIVPLITYGAAAWDAKKTELRELDKIQESIVKRILMTPTS